MKCYKCKQNKGSTITHKFLWFFERIVCMDCAVEMGLAQETDDYFIFDLK
jgi:hypothetical protein